ncbi:nucleoporin 35 [Rhynchophorus ferrugineus]|uniref:Nucleoporin NUP35 n=1 Tax=Rhynchophorus ferrugineus TaxID=354439 RepID=A0A834I8F6_RHYFE|nr:hypothetical protein GWI33_011187 [Rhynchophorus ferrugineus]
MEPMTLGSAPSSPTSPGINPNFLPCFLIGDNPPASPNSNISPGRNRTPSSFKSNSNINEVKSLRQKLFNQSLSTTPASPAPYIPVIEKAGPPKTSLFDTIDGPKKSKDSPILSSTVAHYNDTVVFNESISRIHPDESLNVSRSINNSRLEKIDSHWITVFGFTPSVLNLVLSQLSNCGVIVDKRIPSQGNWVHVKFNNLSEVARSLSLNGKCLNNSIMIGVQLHYDKENKENTTIFTSPIRARSLRHSFVSPQPSNSVVSPQGVPQKSTGIVTKAMEYVFGW